MLLVFNCAGVSVIKKCVFKVMKNMCVCVCVFARSG